MTDVEIHRAIQVLWNETCARAHAVKAELAIIEYDVPRCLVRYYRDGKACAGESFGSELYHPLKALFYCMRQDPIDGPSWLEFYHSNDKRLDTIPSLSLTQPFNIRDGQDNHYDVRVSTGGGEMCEMIVFELVPNYDPWSDQCPAESNAQQHETAD